MNKPIDWAFKAFRVLLAISFIFARYAYSADHAATVEGVLTKMEAADENAKVLKFDFTQRIKFILTGETQIKTGHLIFRKPDNIRIEQNNPAEQVLVSDGKRVWVFTPAYNQLVIDDWKKWLKNNELAYIFFSFAKSFKEFEKQYNFSYVSESEKGILLSLEPINKDRPKMNLLVDETTFMPVQTTVFLENVEIVSGVENLIINPKVNDEDFKFRSPDKSNIIKLY